MNHDPENSMEQRAMAGSTNSYEWAALIMLQTDRDSLIVVSQICVVLMP